MKKRTSFNSKRRFYDVRAKWKYQGTLEELADRATYGGNPEHKRKPGNFNLSPPSRPRPDKTLCDTVSIFDRNVAEELLKSGMRRGMISEQERDGWPQNVWVVTERGNVLEAQLENQETGAYHGYPLQESDPFREAVLTKWNQAWV